MAASNSESRGTCAACRSPSIVYWRGTFDAPAAIEVSVAELTLPDATLAPCSYTSGGLGGRFVFRVPPHDPGLAPLLRTRWTAAVRAGYRVCG